MSQCVSFCLFRTSLSKALNLQLSQVYFRTISCHFKLSDLTSLDRQSLKYFMLFIKRLATNVNKVMRQKI